MYRQTLFKVCFIKSVSFYVKTALMGKFCSPLTHKPGLISTTLPAIAYEGEDLLQFGDMVGVQMMQIFVLMLPA